MSFQESKQRPPGMERELKLALEEEGFRRLRAAAVEVGEEVLQVNTFLDTPEGLLRSCRHALRVRDEGGRCLLTVKGPKTMAGNLAVRREEECELPGEVAERMLAGVAVAELPALPPLRHLRAVCGARWEGAVLRPVVSFRNTRLPVVFGAGGVRLEAVLDRTEYADGAVFFELEAEFEDEEGYRRAEPAFRELFAGLGVPWVPSERSKFGRALERAGLTA